MKKSMKKSPINAQKMGQIMGINVTSTRVNEVLSRVEDFISDSAKFYIVTPNPELILMAQKNNSLKSALNSADLAIPDGVGLKIADSSLNIIKGRELFFALIKLAEKKKWKVFLLGGLGDEAQIALQKLQISNPKLEIQSFRGPELNPNADPISVTDKELETEAISQINSFAPELLFVAFGNPKQEIWIHKNFGKFKIGGAMAVGGTFRYVAGLSSFPPKWMEKAGLEWLWRLIAEPSRAGRIFNAVFVFPVKVFLEPRP